MRRKSLDPTQGRACSGRAGCAVLPLAAATRERCLLSVTLHRVDASCQTCSGIHLCISWQQKQDLVQLLSPQLLPYLEEIPDGSLGPALR